MEKKVEQITWRREKTLGKGSAGMVSLASCCSSNYQNNTSNSLPRVFAVKSSEQSCAGPLVKEEKVLREFEDCPYVIHCFGADSTEEDGKVLYNVMLEYASCGSLYDRIHNSKKRLSENEVKRYTKSILMGLKCIHGRGYVHRDIKPQNILLMDDGTTKIADFGIAKKVDKLREKKKEGKKKVRCTARYATPEAIKDGEYEPAVDIWALGCSVVEMLTKKSIWEFYLNKNVVTLLCQVGLGEPVIPKGLSKDAMDFVKQCLIKDSKQRWSADRLLAHPFITS